MYSKFYYMVWTGLHNLGNGNLSLSNSFLTFLIMKFLISKMFPNSKFAIYFFSQYRYRDRFSSSVERFSSLFSTTETDSISIPSNRQLSSAEHAVGQRQKNSFVDRSLMEMFASKDEVDADRTICAQPSTESSKYFNQ